MAGKLLVVEVGTNIDVPHRVDKFFIHLSALFEKKSNSVIIGFL